MAAVTAYRYTASCIPAAVEYFRERLALGELLPGTRELSKEEEKEFLEALKGQDEEWEAGIDVTKELGRIIQHILSRCPAPGKDSKYQALLAVINKIWDFDRVAKNPRRKIVIFSYFRRTLEYLRKQLSIQSIATRVIHGDVPMSERLDYIEEFLASSEINILLSSEVGGEGIDLQRASVIVNYDLPWNPMVVEQRIGRIDRIGQMADKMVIVNLVAEGTIEQRILLRLYERIGLFREAIGELDDIIGPMDLQNLLVDALRGDLSEEQIQKRIDSTAKAAEEKLGDAGVRSCLLP
jgi:SNF2 family DNA or RNA helicase